MRDIPVGNGNLLVNFDDKYQIRDVYFPHVGQENHSEGFPFRFGVWADGVFSWVFDDGWERDLRYRAESAITDVTLVNRSLGISISSSDMVAADENVFLRCLRVRDTSGSARSVRVFLHQDFRIYENKVGDTAFFDPDTMALVHYQKHRYFLVNTLPAFDQFATGRKAFRDLQGTWRDAEDGVLSGGAITEGSVDSTIAVHLDVPAGAEAEFYYWIAAGTSLAEVGHLNKSVLAAGPASHFSHPPDQYEHRTKVDLSSLRPEILDLYDRSLHIIRTQIDKGGAILAANDYDVTERATDHYSYVWPRDGAFVANALDRAGFPEISARFFHFCHRIVHERGYFLQKYNADGTVGSGWHAHWDAFRKRRLVPIQEDETALVLWALWEHHQRTGEHSVASSLYAGLVVKCADFMAEFRDSSTGLPLASWNLWEDRLGVHTFTCAAVVAGLRAAAGFAREHGESERAERWTSAAEEVVAGMREHLFDAERQCFLRALLTDGDNAPHPDKTVDASLFATFYLGCFGADDPLVTGTMAAVERELVNTTGVGGVARFENDGYMRQQPGVTGNSWIICTLWLAEYYIAINETARAAELIEWVVACSFPSGVLPEQIDPITAEPLSVSPLTWSHSTFVATVLSYVSKLRQNEAAATR